MYSHNRRTVIVIISLLAALALALGALWWVSRKHSVKNGTTPLTFKQFIGVGGGKGVGGLSDTLSSLFTNPTSTPPSGAGSTGSTPGGTTGSLGNGTGAGVGGNGNGGINGGGGSGNTGGSASSQFTNGATSPAAPSGTGGYDASGTYVGAGGAYNSTGQYVGIGTRSGGLVAPNGIGGWNKHGKYVGAGGAYNSTGQYVGTGHIAGYDANGNYIGAAGLYNAAGQYLGIGAQGNGLGATNTLGGYDANGNYIGAGGLYTAGGDYVGSTTAGGFGNGNGSGTNGNGSLGGNGGIGNTIGGVGSSIIPGSGGLSAGDTTTLSCTDRDNNIAFTADEIKQLNNLQERFYAIAQNLHTDADAKIELANHDNFKAKLAHVTELDTYCKTNAPNIPSTFSIARVPTPFWYDPVVNNKPINSVTFSQLYNERLNYNPANVETFINQNSNLHDPYDLGKNITEVALRISLW